MSLFGAIAGIGRVLAGRGVIRGTLGKILGGAKKPKQLPLPGVSTPPIISRPLTTTLPAVVRRGLPAARRAIGGVAAGAVGAAIVGQAIDPRTGLPKKKRRRMNPCNDKALRRALRRIEMWDRQRKRVEKALRRACPPSRRRATPSRTSGAHKH